MVLWLLIQSLISLLGITQLSDILESIAMMPPYFPIAHQNPFKAIEHRSHPAVCFWFAENMSSAVNFISLLMQIFPHPPNTSIHNISMWELARSVLWYASAVSQQSPEIWIRYTPEMSHLTALPVSRSTYYSHASHSNSIWYVPSQYKLSVSI